MKNILCEEQRTQLSHGNICEGQPAKPPYYTDLSSSAITALRVHV